MIDIRLQLQCLRHWVSGLSSLWNMNASGKCVLIRQVQTGFINSNLSQKCSLTCSVLVYFNS